MIDKVKSLVEANHKWVLVAYIVLAIAGTVAMVEGLGVLGSVVYLLAGVAGAGHGLVSKGEGSALGTLLLFSSTLIGRVAGEPLLGLVLAIVGLVMSLQLLKIKGE